MALRKIPMTARTKSNQIMAKASGVKSLAGGVSLKPMSSKRIQTPSYSANTLAKAMVGMSKAMPRNMTGVKKQTSAITRKK